MAKNNTLDMVNGSPMRTIILFSLPILFGNIFQQLYNVVDTAVIGNVLGDNALAAVGATAALYGVVLGLASGMTNGFAVVLARYYGAADKERVNRTVSLTFALTAVIAVIFTLISVIFLRPVLGFLAIPDNIIGDSQIYLEIILAFMVITLFYNTLAGLLRAIGDSKTPLVALVISTIINIILDIALVKWMHMGVAGAAIATVISQLVSVIYCVVYIIRKCPVLIPHKQYMVMDKGIIADLLTTGLSMGLMYAIVSIGSVALQKSVNSLGQRTITAHTAARKIDDIFMMPLGTLSTAASTFASQNYGAGNMKRVIRGIKDSLIIAFIWSGICCILAFAGSGLMTRLLTGTTDGLVIDTASKYIHINIPFFFVLSFLLILRCSLQGVGHKLVPLTGSIIELVFKFGAVGLITPVMGYMGVCITEPVIWTVCGIIVLIDFIVFIRKQNVKNI